MTAGRLSALIGAELGTALAEAGHSPQRVDEAKRELESWFDARRAALERRRGLLAGAAVRWTGVGRAELVEIEVPRPGRGEVTLAVTTSVVSTGTERAHFLRLPNTRPSFGQSPGYSAAGVVLEVGSGVAGLGVGDLVAAPRVPHVSVATVPAQAVIRVPEGVAPEDAAFVRLGVIARAGVRRARILEGEAVCILGAGLIGALAQRLSSAAGAAEVTVVAMSRRHEASARAGGASRFLVAGEDDEAIRALAAPAVIDATGNPDAVSAAVSAAGPGGRVVVLGSPRGTTRAMPFEEIRARELRLVGAHVSSLEEEGRRLGVDLATEEAEAFLRLLQDRRVAVSDLVTRVVDPREAGAFYRTLATDRDLVAARFDWTLLPPPERARPARLLRLPDLTARGLELESALAPARHASGDPLASASGRLRVALLGCGEIGVRNAAALALAPNTELVCCYDPVATLADDVARRFGGTAAPSAEALLERRDLDAVLLAVPHDEHAPLALEALRAGLHVIVEKPLANDLASAVELARAAERSGKILSTCFPYRYEPAVVATREHVQDGALGTFTGCLLTFLIDKPPSYWVGGWTGRASSTWRGSRSQAGGGVLIMNLCHYLDLLRYLTGEEVDAVAAVTGFAEALAEVEDTISLTMSFGNGAVGSIAGSSAVPGSNETRLELWGTDGRVQVEPHGYAYTRQVVDGLRPDRWHRVPAASPVDARVVYLSRLATAIDRGVEPDVTADDGLAVQAIIEAAYRSSASLEFVRPADLLAGER
jgi:predicted dehydrogenase/D-arabinose 1-dehydrogenase-like Zn-dependent alcohol dehydrogenase